MGAGLIEETLPRIEHGEVVVGLRIVGLKPQRLLVMRDRLGEVPESPQRRCSIQNALCSTG